MEADVNDNVVFKGRLSELYKLAKEGKIPTNLQGSHTRPCKFWTATKILSGINNSVIITHGPSGCAYGVKKTYKLTNSRNSGSAYEPVISTNMNENKIVYGGDKELAGALLEVDEKYHPDIIFVASSCATGIIGDNIDAIVDKAKEKINAKIMAIHCEGFAGEYRTGFDLVFQELTKLMDRPTKEVQEELKHSVNIVGGKMGPERTEIQTDVKELVRLIEGMGANVHSVIAGNCTLDELKKAPSVAVNCTLCLDIGYAVGNAMLNEFNTPLNSTILPYGIEATKRWIRGASKYLKLEKEAEDLINKEYESIKDEYEKALEKLKGKTAIIEGHDAIKCLSIAHMLEKDFKMNVIIYNFHPWSTDARQTSIDYLLETEMDPKIIITKGTLAFGKYESMKQTEDELMNFIGDLNPETTVYFGSSLSFPNIPVVDLNAILNRPRFGFAGALKVAKCINTALEYSFRGRSKMFKKIVFPENNNKGIQGSSLTDKLGTEMPDCTMYGERRRGRCMMS